jgi:hypothetical protein
VPPLPLVDHSGFALFPALKGECGSTASVLIA